MSEEGQPCPTCGKVFKRLASHKCKVAGAGQVTNTTSSSPGQDLQQCPTCGQTFKRLSMHKCKAVPQVAPSAFTWSGASETSEGALQTFPGCGQQFKRLAQHRCQGRDTQSAKWDDGSSTRSIESSGTLQICPGCGQQFKRLALHRCKGRQDSPSRTRSDEPTYRRQTQSAKWDDGSGSTRSIESSDTLQVCTGCGQQFKRLSQHRCKGRQDSPPRTRGDERLETCSGCGQQFKRLSQHKCKRIMTGSDNFVDAWVKRSDALEPCPGCGQMYQRLSMHKCKGRDTGGARNSHFEDAFNLRATLQRSLTDYNQSPNSDGKEDCPQVCTGCGQTFKRISMHKCKGRQAPLKNDDDDWNLQRTLEQSLTDYNQGQTSAGKDPCPQVCTGCGQTFKRITMHKCKGRQADDDDDWNLQRTLGQSLTEYNQGQTTTGKGDSLQVCRGCGQTFKRISMHKCKGRPMSSPQHDDNDISLQLALELSRADYKHGQPTPPLSTSTDAPPKDRKPCPTCGELFKRLDLHHCKAPKPTANCSTDYWRGGAEAAIGAYAKPQGQDDDKKPCPTCGQLFKRLDLHRCKGPNITPNPSPINGLGSAVATGHHPISRSLSTISSTTSAATSYLDDEAFSLMKKLDISPSSDPRHDTLQFFDDDCKLMQEEKQKAQAAFNKLRTIMIEELEKHTKWQWEPFNSGSSYDGTKVTRPDEVDCMFVPAIPGECFKIKLEGAPPGFCFVEFHPKAAPVSDTDSTSSSFLEAQQAALDGLAEMCERSPGSRAKLVRSDRFREMTHGIFKIAVGIERKAKEDPHYKPGSPAYPIILNVVPSKPAINIDSVPALRVAGLPPGTEKVIRRLPDDDAKVVQKNGCHVTPKQCKIGTFKEVKHLLWRISFSSAEKQLTKYADQRTKGPNREQPTCRKEVLRILKRLLEVFKGFDNSKRGLKNRTMLHLKKAAEQLRKTRNGRIESFTTFEIRNFMLCEFYENCPGAEKWTLENRRARLQHALIHLKKMITGQSTVPHFFLRTAIPNIMQDVPTEERDFLYIMFTIAEKLF